MLRDSTRDSAGDAIFDGSYEVISAVGRGRNSVVYKARRLPGPEGQRIGPEYVALKVLIGNARNPLIHFRRMKREALAMLSCVHKNVVRLTDYVTHGELCYLSMEFAERGDLKQMLDRQRLPFAPQLALRLMVQVMEGLGKIHRVGILHRDVKPENLLLTEDCVIKIADFGIACLPSEEVPIEEANRGIGTFDYLAPESLEEGISNEATDVYSCAVTFYQLLTGHLPFGGNSFTEQIESKMGSNVIPLSNLIKNVPPLLQEFVAQALVSDPARRYTTAAAFREALQAFLEGSWEPDMEVEPAARQPSRLLGQPVGKESDGGKDEDEREACQGNGLAVDSRESGVDLGSAGRQLSAEPPAADKGVESDRAQALLSGARDESVQTGIEWEEAERRSFIGRVLFWLFTPRRLVLLIALGFAVFFFANLLFTGSVEKDASVYNGPDRVLDVTQEEGLVRERKVVPIADATIPADASAFSFLMDGEHVGLLYGLLSDEGDVSLVTAPGVGNRDVVVVLALSGWEPVVIDARLVRSEQELRLSGSGMRLSLSVDRVDGSKGSIVSGTYREHVSGREGRWAIW